MLLLGKEKSMTIKSKYNNGDYVYNGIDRIDNNDSYNLINCVPCCNVCNIAKSDTSYDDYINSIKQSYEHLKQQGIIK